LPPHSWHWALLRERSLREARRIVGNQEDAEEAVQEALTRAWRARSRTDGIESPTAWLLQITRNESLRVLERRARLRTRELPEGSVAEPCAEDRQIEQLVSHAPTRQALHRLDPGERTLLLLRYGEDLTQPELARRLDLPEGTVKVRLHRIRKRFAEALEECA
jgi:RNA polymerase sigma-70 factor (ECF subfamily)